MAIKIRFCNELPLTMWTIKLHIVMDGFNVFAHAVNIGKISSTATFARDSNFFVDFSDVALQVMLVSEAFVASFPRAFELFCLITLDNRKLWLGQSFLLFGRR
jgi:hypothetical protein